MIDINQRMERIGELITGLREGLDRDERCQYDLDRRLVEFDRELASEEAQLRLIATAVLLQRLDA